MMLPGLKCGIICIAFFKGISDVLAQNITIASTTTTSLPPRGVPSSDPITESTSIPLVIPTMARTKPSAEPFTAPPAKSTRKYNLSSNAPTTASAKKPNILVILADDVGTGDIPLYWNSGLVDMPNVERLANMGVTFKDAHSTPLCAPSRYMLLSGNYAHRGRKPGGTWNIGNRNQFRWFQKSIAETLKESGNYSTAMYGKWHLGGQIPSNLEDGINMTNPLSHWSHNWSLPLIDGPQDTGFASSLITTAGIQKSPYSYFRDGLLTTKKSDVVSWKKGRYNMSCGTSFINRKGEGDPDWDSSAYNMVVVNETARFIDAHIVSDRSEDPWFIYAALGAVHDPHSPPNFYLDGTPIAGTHKSRHMDMLYEMDKAVGSLVAIIEERGLANNTIILFASDNGGAGDRFTSAEFGHNSHGPLRGKKGEVYEGGHRVPMIFRYDGHFPVNETRSRMVGLNDVYRTLCNLTGIEVPKGSAQDSQSFADYIFSDSNVRNLRKYLATSAITRGQISEGIRFDNMKLIRHHNAAATTELYDLDSDLGEENNLIFNQTYTEIVKKMVKKLSREGPCPKSGGRFKLKGGPLKGKRKSCKFFSRKPKRCNTGVYLHAVKYCSSICGRHQPFCDNVYSL